MAEEKQQFYWLKFQKDFFKSLRIKKLRKLAGGDTYTIIYLKLQLLSITTGGYLVYKGVFETFEEEMEEEIGETADNIKITIQYLLSCGLMEKNENEYFLPYVPKNTGRESASAIRAKNFRDNMSIEQKEKEKERVKNAVTESRKKVKCLTTIEEHNNCEIVVTECNELVTNSNELVTNSNELVTNCNELVTNCNEHVTSVEKEIEIDIDINKKRNIKEKKSNQQVDSESASKKPKDFDEDINAIYLKWNRVIAQPRVSKISGKRKKNLIKLLEEYEVNRVLDAIDIIYASDFLSGRGSSTFMANFDWFIKPDIFLRIIEGAYNNSTGKPKNNFSVQNQNYYDMDEYEQSILSN